MFRLKRQLKNTKQATQPSVKFRARLMSELRMEYDKTYGCPKPSRFLFVPIVAASLILMFAMGTGVYAYESPEVTQGHPLHFMKAGIEFVRERAAFSPKARAKFHADMMDRRLQEGERHYPVRPERVPVSLEAAAQQFELTIQALEEGVEDEALREALIEALSIKHERYLQLQSRVQIDEPGEAGSGEENGSSDPLRMRIEADQLSEQEFMRLFKQERRSRHPLNRP
jgi:hypothetical protein